MSESKAAQELRDKAIQFAASAWQTPKTSHIAMNVELGEAFANNIAPVLAELAAWKETAERESRNRDYYRGLVVKCGECFGVVAKTQDDGGIVEDVLCAKVPELVVEATKQLAAEKEHSNAMASDLCKIEDALGFKNDQHDKSGAFVATIGPLMERLRDLIAAEGELGDIKQHS